MGLYELMSEWSLLADGAMQMAVMTPGESSMSDQRIQLLIPVLLPIELNKTLPVEQVRYHRQWV